MIDLYSEMMSLLRDQESAIRCKDYESAEKLREEIKQVLKKIINKS